VFASHNNPSGCAIDRPGGKRTSLHCSKNVDKKIDYLQKIFKLAVMLTVSLEPISKKRLSAHGCVADRLKMLTY